MRAHRVTLLLLALLALSFGALVSTASGADGRDGRAPERIPARGQEGRVLVAPLTGTVDPVMLEFVDRVIERAEGTDDGFDAIVFELDTPGGLSTSMGSIVRAIVGAKVPIYVYVSPGGGRAASAGVFITYASDIAAMAPGTNIGSATPIASNGDELSKDLRKKVINDATAQIGELARERGRDEEFARTAITEARNIGAREALEAGVVEYVADDVRDLLERSDGAMVVTKDQQVRLGDSRLERMEPPLTLRILKLLVDPNLLFLLFGAGVIGLAFELTHPGVVVPGVAGGICLLLSLYGLSVLPATGTGITLLVLAAALFAAEAVAPGGGVLGVGGAVALLVGALLLFDDNSEYGVSVPLAVGMSLAFLAFFSLLLRKAVATRRLAPTTGSESLIGMRGVVRQGVSPGTVGSIYVDGELWSASGDFDLAPGSPARVIAVDGLVAQVERVESTREESPQ